MLCLTWRRVATGAGRAFAWIKVTEASHRRGILLVQDAPSAPPKVSQC